MKVAVYFSISQLVFSGFHFGSPTSRWWSHTSVFLSFSRKGYFFFDLQYTVFCFRRALLFIEGLAKYRSSVLFVFGSYSLRFFRRKVNRLGCYWHLGKTTPGLLSNYRSVLKRQIPGIGPFPSAVVVLDPLTSLYIFREGGLLGLPILSVCDSSMDPSYITYPIPGNSSGFDVSKFLLLLCLEAVLRGSRIRMAFRYYRRPKVNYRPFGGRFKPNLGRGKDWKKKDLSWKSRVKIRTV